MPYKYQYGFRQKQSIIHALVKLIEYIKMKIDQGDYFCGVLLKQHLIQDIIKF